MPIEDDIIARWFQRRKNFTPAASRRSPYSIAIESSPQALQSSIAHNLALYLNEFDDTELDSPWLPIADAQLSVLCQKETFQELCSGQGSDSSSSAIHYLCSEGHIIFELPECHESTGQDDRVFQVSLAGTETSHRRHHLWINANRVGLKTLIPMIANSYLDWSVNGGDSPMHPASS